MTCYILVIVGFTLVIKHDAIKFLINDNNNAEAKRVIAKVYKYCNTNEK